VRAIAYNLRPLHLDRLGLTAVIEEMVEKMSTASGIQFFTDVAPLDGLFTKDGEINFYRVIQESVNNIVKHSQATKANVEILCENGAVQVTVRDNGRGFVAASSTDSIRPPVTRGLGLVGIAERVRILGGSHTILSAPGQGTTLSITIPIADQKGAEHSG
jgi:signal transduction histidine kinase